MRTCRLCNSKLEVVLDLGNQCLSGQFPAADAPDPPRYPLVFCRCNSCGLAQLSETVPPDMMYRDYWYRSGVTQTMRDHLRFVAQEAIYLCEPERVLDIGCNDGTFLNNFDCELVVGVDPSSDFGVRDYYPSKEVTLRYDLITTLACFYDVDDPVGFMRAIHEQLTSDGLWCVEVASLSLMLSRGMFDGICHEHLTYWTIDTLADCADRCGLKLVHYYHSDINGGSIRCYFARRESAQWVQVASPYESEDYEGFVQHVEAACTAIKRAAVSKRCIHLLGASTKSNTILQYCGLTSSFIQAASDRDPRKRGRVTPGTRIPIISEEESRAMRPDAYLCFLHNVEEVKARESDIPIIFPFAEVCDAAW